MDQISYCLCEIEVCGEGVEEKTTKETKDMKRWIRGKIKAILAPMVERDVSCH